jgi:hypothetical protein
MSAVWYWRHGGEQHGPITWQKLQAMAAKGRISPSDWVMREGWADWKLACEVNEEVAAAEPALSLSMGGEASASPAAGAPVRLPEPPPPVAELAASLPPPPPLPINMSVPLGVATAPVVPVAAPVPVPPPPAVVVPVAMVAAPAAVLAVAPLPPPVLPPLAPDETVEANAGTDPAHEPDAAGVTTSQVNDLRRALTELPEDRRPISPSSRPSLIEIGALAAAVVGLLVLPFEMGIVALGLGVWCLMHATEAQPAGLGRTFAVGAVVIGGINLVFAVAGSFVDLGLKM